MKTISDNLKNSLARKSPVYKKTVYLYKRLWSAGAYVYDAPIDITDEIESYGDLLWKLDNEGFNVWNLSNTTLTLRNDRNQWLQDNATGFFTSGYIINQSKIKIKVGAELADGSIEDLYAFSGYISGSLNYDTERKKVIITLISAMSIFDKFNAEDISETEPDELLGSDTGSVFTTAQNGVGLIDIIKRGLSLETATEIKANTDYQLTDLNTKGTPLTVTLTTGLTAGENLYITYKYWYEDKTIEWIIEEIMTLCGIGSYSIQKAEYAVGIENTWDFKTQDDWETGTLTNIDTTSSSGSFMRKWFLIDDFSGSLVWTVSKSVAGHTWGIVSEVLKSTINATTGGVSVIKSLWMTEYYGTWNFKAWTTVGYHNFIRVFFIVGSEYLGQPREGYFLKIHSNDGYVKLYRSDDVTGQSGADNNSVLLLTINHRMISTDIIRVTRDSTGKFNVFINGSDNDGEWTVTNNDYQGNRGMYLEVFANTDASVSQYFDDFYFSNAPDGTSAIDISDAVFESPVNDSGENLLSYGFLEEISTLYNGTITIETATSDDGITYDGWEIVTDSIIASANKRYIKFKVSLGITAQTNIETPIIDQIRIKYYTSTTVISLVNLTGLNCRQALEILAKMPNFEIVFDTDDKFYFRERITGGEPVLDIKGEDNLKQLTNYKQGVSRVYNLVTAEFGDYRVDSNASSDAEPNSVTKYGTRIYSISSNQLLPNENANIAYAIAPTILAYTKNPRKRCQIETQFLPQLELGDKITLFYEEPSALKLWHWGDISVNWGDPDIEYFNAATIENRYNFWNAIMRIEGIRLNLNNYITNFDLTEVI